MSRYKKIMLQRGVMQKDVLADVRKVDPRVDNPLLSKFVNDVCLPSPRTLESICKSLSCAPLDIYDPREIELAPRSDSDVEKPPQRAADNPPPRERSRNAPVGVIKTYITLPSKYRATSPSVYLRPPRYAN